MKAEISEASSEMNHNDLTGMHQQPIPLYQLKARLQLKSESKRWLSKMMKLKLIVTLVVGIAIGFGIRSLVPPRLTVADHWQIVNEYRDHVFNPENYTPDPQTGLSVTEAPQDLDPSLAALVSAGELRYLDIVLPTVPYSNRDATRHWLAFCERHRDEIVWGYGNPSSVAFPTKGEQPLHLRMWFPESSIPVVQQLIEELEEMGNEPTTKSTLSSEAAPSAAPSER